MMKTYIKEYSLTKLCSIFIFIILSFTDREVKSQDIQMLGYPTEDARLGNFGLKVASRLSWISNCPETTHPLAGYTLLTYFTKNELAGKFVDFKSEAGYTSKGLSPSSCNKFTLSYVDVNESLKVRLFKEVTTPSIYGGFSLSLLVSVRNKLSSFLTENYFGGNDDALNLNLLD